MGIEDKERTERREELHLVVSDLISIDQNNIIQVLNAGDNEIFRWILNNHQSYLNTLLKDPDGTFVNQAIDTLKSLGESGLTVQNSEIEESIKELVAFAKQIEVASTDLILPHKKAAEELELKFEECDNDADEVMILLELDYHYTIILEHCLGEEDAKKYSSQFQDSNELLSYCREDLEPELYSKVVLRRFVEMDSKDPAAIESLLTKDNIKALIDAGNLKSNYGKDHAPVALRKDVEHYLANKDGAQECYQYFREQIVKEDLGYQFNNNLAKPFVNVVLTFFKGLGEDMRDLIRELDLVDESEDELEQSTDDLDGQDNRRSDESQRSEWSEVDLAQMLAFLSYDMPDGIPKNAQEFTGGMSDEMLHALIFDDEKQQQEINAVQKLVNKLSVTPINVDKMLALIHEQLDFIFNELDCGGELEAVSNILLKKEPLDAVDHATLREELIPIIQQSLDDYTEGLEDHQSSESRSNATSEESVEKLSSSRSGFFSSVSDQEKDSTRQSGVFDHSDSELDDSRASKP